jgi:nitroreductase
VELSEVITLRRMTRNFTARPLDDQVVDDLLTLALRAPSAGHTQGREFVVLEGAEQTARYWQATTDEEWRTGSRRYAGLSRAPVIVLVFADPAAYVARYRERDKEQPDGKQVEWTVPFWFVDAGFAVMHLLLGATDREIGAAFLGNFRGEDALRSSLGVPDRLRWLGAVLLGEPAEPDPPSSSSARPRRTLGDSVHRGGW